MHKISTILHNPFRTNFPVHTLLLRLALTGLILASTAAVFTAEALCEPSARKLEPVIDRAGRVIKVPSPFKRIISLYAAHTQNLAHLGLEHQTLGISINDTLPKGWGEKPRFSYHDDPEKFLAFKPDLILIRPMIDNGYPDLVKQLEKYGIVVASLQPSGIEQVYAYWLKLGSLTGTRCTARSMVMDFKTKTDQIRAITHTIIPKKRVYFEAIHSRMKTFTPGAMAIFALETAGGINVAGDAKASRNTNIAVYGKEQILAKAGSIDIFLSQKGVMNRVSREQIQSEPGFGVIKAIKHNQIFLIDESIISRPVPGLYQGIVTIARILYPDHPLLEHAIKENQ